MGEKANEAELAYAEMIEQDCRLEWFSPAELLEMDREKRIEDADGLAQVRR